jgi:predicted DNA-binding transcriptional regulator YafY
VYALRDEQEILTWLLTWGSSVEVLGPASLRASLAEEARALLARHASPSVAPPSPTMTAHPIAAT